MIKNTIELIEKQKDKIGGLVLILCERLECKQEQTTITGNCVYNLPYTFKDTTVYICYYKLRDLK